MESGRVKTIGRRGEIVGIEMRENDGRSSNTSSPSGQSDPMCVIRVRFRA
jgi:hypothetical protein